MTRSRLSGEGGGVEGGEMRLEKIIERNNLPQPDLTVVLCGSRANRANTQNRLEPR